MADLVAFVGCYATPAREGGISVFAVDLDAKALVETGRADRALEAGYLVYAASTQSLYAVDERKTDGRGPVGPAASVHCFGFEAERGQLRWRNAHPAPGPFPTFLSLCETGGLLASANHGSFDHVERVVRTGDGAWSVKYLYDDSTVILYRIEPDGRIGPILDLKVLEGHGPDPNGSPQAGGHAQSGPHAHCAVIDPSGRYLAVCDKGTDRVLVFRLGGELTFVSALDFSPETGPRHLAFDAGSGRAFATLEFSSELAVLDFDTGSGSFRLIGKVSTVATGHQGLNEPAEVRVHPNGRFVYVNNRGEDSLAWFGVSPDGALRRLGHVHVAPSVHPGLAARSFAFDPSGRVILFADRPANLIRMFSIDEATGEPVPVAQASVDAPAFIEFATLPWPATAHGRRHLPPMQQETV